MIELKKTPRGSETDFRKTSFRVPVSLSDKIETAAAKASKKHGEYISYSDAIMQGLDEVFGGLKPDLALVKEVRATEGLGKAPPKGKKGKPAKAKAKAAKTEKVSKPAKKAKTKAKKAAKKAEAKAAAPAKARAPKAKAKAKKAPESASEPAATAPAVDAVALANGAADSQGTQAPAVA